MGGVTAIFPLWHPDGLVSLPQSGVNLSGICDPGPAGSLCFRLTVFSLSFIGFEGSSGILKITACCHFSVVIYSLLNFFIIPPSAPKHSCRRSMPSHRVSPGGISERQRGLQQSRWPTGGLALARRSNTAYGNSYSCVIFLKE